MLRSIMFIFVCLCLAGCSSNGCNTHFMGTSDDQEAKKRQDIKDADALVHSWAEKMTKSEEGGFVKPEGLTDLDPWNNQIKIDYHQEWTQEVVIISSAGPDGYFGTKDDLMRKRTASNPSGLLKGLPGWLWMVLIWCFCGFLAFLASAGIRQNRIAKGKSSTHKHPVIFTILVILFAPLALILLGLQYIGGTLGATGEFFDGFDFNFELDLDL